MGIAIPVHYGIPEAPVLAEELRDFGIVVVDTVRPTAAQRARELSAELGIKDDDDGAEGCLHHLSCAVDPVMEYGWVDYYVYSQVFDGSPSKAETLVGAAVRQWGTVGKPARHLAVLRTQAS